MAALLVKKVYLPALFNDVITVSLKSAVCSKSKIVLLLSNNPHLVRRSKFQDLSVPLILLISRPSDMVN